jgi:predicted acetyltransferase
MIAKLIPATLKDYPTIQNMARFYVYEMSRECGLNSADWACPIDGLYESFDFKHYFTDTDRKAYLVNVNEELAGFVLIYPTGKQPNIQWHMGEFFILARFQQRGIGRLVAQQVWNHHPGSWEVTVIPENQRALQFWRKAIAATVDHNFSEKIKRKEGRVDPAQPNRIFFTFDTRIATTSPNKRTT